MWKLMQADFRYNRITIFCLYGVFFIFALINAIVGNMEGPLSILMLILVWLVVIGSTVEMKTKKIRFMAALPVSARALGMHRVGAFTCWWLGMLLMLFLSTLISQHGQIGLHYVWWLLTITGSMFLFIGFGTLSADLYFCVKDRKWGRKMMNWIVGPLITVLLLASNGLYILTFKGSMLSDDFILIGLSKALSKALLTFPWAFVLFLLGCGLLVLTVFAYERRMSYTEQATWPQD
jgi:hypothetical protein